MTSGSANDDALSDLMLLLRENLDPDAFNAACGLMQHVLGASMPAAQDSSPGIGRRLAADAALRRLFPGISRIRNLG
jgi:hypothetical protein